MDTSNKSYSPIEKFFHTILSLSQLSRTLYQLLTSSPLSARCGRVDVSPNALKQILQVTEDILYILLLSNQAIIQYTFIYNICTVNIFTVHTYTYCLYTLNSILLAVIPATKVMEVIPISEENSIPLPLT